LRGRGCFVGAGVALRVADGVGVGVAVGVAEGVAEGVAVGVDEGAGGGVVLGEPVGEADGEGAAVEPDGEGLGTGDAMAGSTRATVEAVIAAPLWALAFALAVLAGNVADAAAAAPDEDAITTAAPAVKAPRTVMTRQVARSAAADRAGSPCLPEPADIRPPCLDYPDIQCERELNLYIVREPGNIVTSPWKSSLASVGWLAAAPPELGVVRVTRVVVVRVLPTAAADQGLVGHRAEPARCERAEV
jgi:hypothetical protein